MTDLPPVTREEREWWALAGYAQTEEATDPWLHRTQRLLAALDRAEQGWREARKESDDALGVAAECMARMNGAEAREQRLREALWGVMRAMDDPDGFQRGDVEWHEARAILNEKGEE